MKNIKFEDIKKDIKGLEKIAEGWRGEIFKGSYKGKVLAFKVPSEPIHIHPILKEGEILKKVNKAGIGGKLVLQGKDFIAYEFIEGKELKKVINQQNAKKIFKQLLEQARKLDKLLITKEEMHKPHSNVLVDKDLNVYLIDFERAKMSKNPKNITQLVQYFLTQGSQYLPSLNKEKLIETMKEYKKSQSEESFEKIKKLLKL